jgi:hypothetical protein
MTYEKLVKIYELLSKIQISEQVQVALIMCTTCLLCLWYGLSMVIGKVAAMVVLIMFTFGLLLFLSVGSVALKAERKPICTSEDICPYPPKKPKLIF